ncbi:MAG: hypothetical protein HZC25_11955 [Rhodospirillales bacterium]|nr:hypothetical protein [Rhodospirillales bacterium]
MTEAQAFAVPPCCLVRRADDPLGPLFLKARRDAKDYVNDYLVPVQAGADLALIYLDPEARLAVVAERPSLVEGPVLERGQASAPGDLIRTQEGFFIKLWDDKKGARHLAYVALASGLVWPRREQGLIAIHRAWRLEV